MEDRYVSSRARPAAGTPEEVAAAFARVEAAIKEAEGLRGSLTEEAVEDLRHRGC